MILGGTTAVAARFAPDLFGGRDPVLVGTAVNAVALAVAFVLGRFRP